MQAVRKRVLEILKREKQATVGELARQLEMAPVSVRYHLDILQGDSLIEVGKVRKEGNVGRPKQVYSLTEEANEHFPDNFAPLTSGLVNQMKKNLSPGQVEAAFCALAREMADDFADPDANESLEERLEKVVGFLNDRGYLARWEKTDTAGNKDIVGKETYLLHTFNCPYAGVSSEHRELCRMDLEFVRELVGHQGCQRVDSLAEEGRCCTYRIRDGSAATEKGDDEILLVSS